jgi:EAL domain-containing protein (putative c-di-GMP-specific phosphodiesterase class I)
MAAQGMSLIINNKEELDLERIRAAAVLRDGKHTGSFANISVQSVFQPIYSLVHARMVGAEGLMRCTSSVGLPVSPLHMLYKQCKSEYDSVLLDRLCRYLHVKNAVSLLPDPCWLFLNVSPRIVIAGRHYGAFFRELLEEAGLPPSRIVVEVLEDPAHEEKQLHKAVDYFRDLGCVIAVDDFGTGHSNFNRVWEINPDIVKLDRSLVERSAIDNRITRTLPNLVDLLHESGCHVLMEGIENEKEAITAVSAGVDMVQGNYFARPGFDLAPEASIEELVSDGHAKFIFTTRDRACSLAHTLKPYIEIFHEALAEPSMAAFDAATSKVLVLPYVLRCYMLDDKGRQIGVSSLPEEFAYLPERKFAVLADGEGADWSTRKYFRTAINTPGEVQISEEYFSIPDGSMCITLSVACEIDVQTQVFCCDLKWR